MLFYPLEAVDGLVGEGRLARLLGLAVAQHQHLTAFLLVAADAAAFSLSA